MIRTEVTAQKRDHRSDSIRSGARVTRSIEILLPGCAHGARIRRLWWPGDCSHELPSYTVSSETVDTAASHRGNARAAAQSRRRRQASHEHRPRDQCGPSHERMSFSYV